MANKSDRGAVSVEGIDLYEVVERPTIALKMVKVLTPIC